MSIEMRPQSEIDVQIDLASEAVDQNSKWPGMSYEQGVDAALRWVCGLSDDLPMEDE